MGTQPLPKRGRAPDFRPMSVAAKRLHGSRYDTIRLTILTCAKKLTSSQLNVLQGTEEKE